MDGMANQPQNVSPTPNGRTPFVCFIAVLVLLFVAELVIGLQDWRHGGGGAFWLVAMQSFAFLGMLWAGGVIVAERCSQLLNWLQRTGRMKLFNVARAIMAVVVSIVWILVVVSFGTRYALNCYASPSLLEFAMENWSNGFWAHTASIYRWILYVLPFFLAGTVAIVARCVWKYGTRLNLLGEDRFKRPVLYVCLALAACFTLSMIALNGESDKGLRNRTVSHLCYKVEPIFAFAMGCADVWHQAQYENAIVDEASFVPLTTPFAAPTSIQRKPNIIFFQIESCRPDVVGMVHQGMEVTPNMNKFARLSRRFTKAYAPATHTSLSNVSVPSSTYPVRRAMLTKYRADDPQPKKLIWDILKPFGYETAFISSDFEGWAGMRDFLLTPALDVFEDSTTSYAKNHPEVSAGQVIHVELAPDRQTTTEAIRYIGTKLDSKQPFYLTLSLSDSHFPYVSSMKTNWFQPCGVPDTCAIFDYPIELRDQIRNSYLNSIRGIDVLFGELVAFLQEKGALDDTIIVIYGDHGESFHENGILSHANLPYDPSARTTLIMYGKGIFSPGVEEYPTSLVDVVPTVLARLGIPHHPNFQGIDVLSSERPSVDTRCLYVHVDGRVNADGVFAAGRWKYFADNGTGATYLYDLAKDSGEEHNLAESSPDVASILAKELETFRVGQLAYYRSSKLYTKFYPPMPPQLKSASQ